MPTHSWASRLGTKVSRLWACHLPLEQRHLNPSFLPVYLMVLAQDKDMLYLLNYQISAQKITVQFRIIYQEQSPAKSQRESKAESKILWTRPSSGMETALSMLCNLNSSGWRGEAQPHVPTKRWQSGRSSHQRASGEKSGPRAVCQP